MIMSELNLRYFAWVRERIGTAQETVVLPAGVITVADLLAWLKERGPEYAHAFERAEIIRAAIDQTHVPHETPVGTAREVAFFPPMTGG